MKLLFTYCLFCITLMYSQVDSSMSTASTVNSLPGTSALPWNVSTNNTQVEDMVNQIATLGVCPTCKTDTLKLSGFSFDIPSGATIKGVQIIIVKKADANASVNDDLVQFNIGSSLVSENKKILATWPQFTLLTSVYGGNSDTWNLAVNASDLNDMEVRFVARAQGASGANIYIDYVYVKVFYQLPISTFENEKPPYVIYPLQPNFSESHFTITESGTAKIMDKQGVVVRELSTPNDWDGTDTQGQVVPSGVYFIYVNEKERIVVSVLK